VQRQAIAANRNAGFQPASDQFAPTRQHQPTHAPFYQIAANRSTIQGNPSHLKNPSLDDWEKTWGKNLQRTLQPKLLPVDFRSPLAAITQ